MKEEWTRRATIIVDRISDHLDLDRNPELAIEWIAEALATAHREGGGERNMEPSALELGAEVRRLGLQGS